MIGFYCCHCAQHIDAPDELGGTSAHCPTCGGEIQVPGRRLPVVAPRLPPALPPDAPVIREGPVVAEAPSPYGTPVYTVSNGPAAPRSWRWVGWIAAASLIAWGICLLGAWLRPPSYREILFGSPRGFVPMLQESLACLVVSSVAALVLSAMTAGILSAFQKAFGRSMVRGYALAVMVVSLCYVIGPAVRYLSHTDEMAYRPPVPAYNPPTPAYVPPSKPYVPASSSSVSSPPDRRSELESAKGLISDMERNIQEASDRNDRLGRYGQSSGSPSAGTPSAGDMEKLRRLTNDFFRAMIAISDSYQKELQEAGLLTLLDADRVAKDKTSRETDAILAKCRVLVERYRVRSSALIDEFPARVQAANFSFNGRDFLAGCQRSIAETQPVLERMWKLEGESIDSMEAMMVHVAKTRTHWAAVKGVFVFENDADLKRFNELAGKVQACVARQDEIRKTSEEKSKKMLSDLKSQLPE